MSANTSDGFGEGQEAQIRFAVFVVFFLAGCLMFVMVPAQAATVYAGGLWLVGCMVMRKYVSAIGPGL